MTFIPYNKNLRYMKPYEPGKSRGNKKSNLPIIKLSSNEACLDFSESTKNKFRKVDANLSRYPNPRAETLREKISRLYKVNKNNIIFGNGSDELFYLICNSYINKDLEGLYSKYGFLIYPLAIKASGGKPVFANETNYKVDINNLIRKVSKKTRVCFIANPNNPTGTYLKKNEIVDLRNKLPSKCLLVIDSAYSEYVTEKDYSDTLEYAKRRKDIVVTHTFSKIFGLAALRLGWAYCPTEVINVLERIRPAFNINSYAQEIGNLVLDDISFLKNSVKHNSFWRKKLTKEFESLGFKVIPSVANFVTVIFKNKKIAFKVANALEDNNIFVRKLVAYKMHNCLRITVGTESQNKKLLSACKKIIRKSHDLV